jgi:hypothetical protein
VRPTRQTRRQKHDHLPNWWLECGGAPSSYKECIEPLAAKMAHANPLRPNSTEATNRPCSAFVCSERVRQKLEKIKPKSLPLQDSPTHLHVLLRSWHPVFKRTLRPRLEYIQHDTSPRRKTPSMTNNEGQMTITRYIAWHRLLDIQCFAGGRPMGRWLIL